MKSNEKKLYLLGQEKVGKALLKLGIPTMIGMMTSALYNLVDSYFVGRLGTNQMAAVSVVYPLSLLILGIGLLFGSGASSYLARLLGAKKYKEANECASTAVASSLVVAGVIIALMLIFLNPLLHFLGASSSNMGFAREYGVVFIIGLMFNIFNICVNNIITAEGASVYSMGAMLIGGVSNIVLDPIMIFGLGLGVQGAAVATLISRIISTTLYIYYIVSGKSNFHFSIHNCKMDGTIFKEIFTIGVPMLIYQVFCSIALALTNQQAVVYGNSVVAAFGVVNRIISVFMMMVMGFLKGFQPFVGYNYGAGANERVEKATKTAILWATTFCVIVAACLIAGSHFWIALFTKNDPMVMKIGAKALILNSITFLTLGYQLVISFRFMGMGFGKEGGMISLGRQGFFFIPILFIMSALFGLNGILLAQPAADLCSLILVFVLSKKDRTPVEKIA